MRRDPFEGVERSETFRSWFETEAIIVFDICNDFSEVTSRLDVHRPSGRLCLYPFLSEVESDTCYPAMEFTSMEEFFPMAAKLIDYIKDNKDGSLTLYSERDKPLVESFRRFMESLLDSVVFEWVGGAWRGCDTYKVRTRRRRG
jgi:hypothetical protein